MRSIIKDEEPMLVVTIGDATYLGFPDHTELIGKNRPVWGIKKIWTDLDGDMVIGYASGSNAKMFVWDDKEDYTYASFNEIPEE